MIRKGRAAQDDRRGLSPRRGRPGEARANNEARADTSRDEASPRPDPLDPQSDDEAFDSSSPVSEDADEGRRSRRPVRSLKMRAIDYLSRREYSRAELTRKLAPFVEPDDELDPLLDALEREGWLSEARFAESVMNRRSSRMGASRIVNELRQHKVDDTLVQSVGAQLRETERARAQAVWRKKFGELPQSPAERMKQTRFLAMRGFSHATISQILKGDDDWSDE
ncbi:recombination regulator RecX [Trinickia sp. NRRL B-1857]|uniref:recombination regulator RecX n=1 Tax=Trinickia sp. NRRL B-1857 TaxID=3162879 RepID=UPI003D29E694